MLHSAKTLKNYQLHSLNGKVGGLSDFYFDDRHWVVRYLIADAGGWLRKKEVMISPHAIEEVLPTVQGIAVNRTKAQIKNSPSPDSDLPVSQQFEQSSFKYLGWPELWVGSSLWSYAPRVIRDHKIFRKSSKQSKAWDPHLRSIYDTEGYSIEATDGEIGRVDDFIVDDDDWSVRYLVVKTGGWFSKKRVLVSSFRSVDRVSWTTGKVTVHLTKALIKLAPVYVEDFLSNQEYERALATFNEKQADWFEEKEKLERGKERVGGRHGTNDGHRSQRGSSFGSDSNAGQGANLGANEDSRRDTLDFDAEFLEQEGHHARQSSPNRPNKEHHRG